MSTLDFLSIGNITRDIIKNSSGQFAGIGGPSFYASKVCENFGIKAGICTNFSNDFKITEYLPNTEIFSYQSELTTSFVNNYSKGVRTQKIVNNASFLEFERFSYLNDLLSPKVVFYCPVFNEVEHDFLSIFNQSKKICNLQGWLREAGPNKEVSLNKLLPSLDFSIFDAIVLSELDLAQDEISRLTNLSSLVCVTKGKEGCVITNNQKEIKFDTVKVKSIDETGAGDVWASVFGIQKFIFNSSLEESARKANLAASLSIGSVGASCIPTLSMLDKLINELW